MCAAISAVAQNKASIRGIVKDSLNKGVLEFATVAVVHARDSSLISYTLTDKEGKFILRNLPPDQNLRILISYVGYESFRRNLSFRKGEERDLKTIYLSNKSLEEVVITAEHVPVVMKKDTIEFNAEAFKTRPNAVVEELLKKMPGVQVDNDGSISVNGKKVSKLLVDGKEFFGNDPKVATRNLDAELVAKVQVYDDREDDPDHLIEDSKVNKIVNLKLKKAIKKSVFGKVYAGGGSRERFEGGALLNMFRDTLQLSVIGVANNLNRTGFSNNDLYSMGGFGRSGGEALYNGAVSLGGRNYGGIEQVASGGFNLNYDYGKKLKLNLLYFYNTSHADYGNSFNQQQTLNDTVLFTGGGGMYKRSEDKHTLTATVEWKPDTLTQIRYKPSLNVGNNGSSSSYSSVRSSNFVSRINESVNQNRTDGERTTFNHSFSYYRRLKRKGESFSINHNMQVNPGKDLSFSDNNLLSYTSAMRPDTLNRSTDNSNRTVSAGLELSYRYPFNKKLTGYISAGGSYAKNGRASFIYNLDRSTGLYSQLLTDQSSDLDRNQWEEKLRPGFTWQIKKKVSLDMGLGMQWLQVENVFHRDIDDLKQRYFNLLPSMRLTVGDCSLNYDVSFDLPDIYNLQPVSIVSSQLYTFTGNPLLKPSKRHNVSLNYYSYNYQSQLSTNFYLGGSVQENSVFRKRTVNSTGAEVNSPVNRNGQYNAYNGFGVGKRFKKTKDIQFGFNANVNFNYSRNFFEINRDEGYQNNYSFNFTPSLSFNWKDKIDLSPSYSLRPTLTRYKDVDYKDVDYTYHTINTRYTIRWPKKIYWEGNYSYSYNPLVSEGFQKSTHLLNVALALQMLKKDRGEIKLSCYDLLDQNINAYRYAYENTVIDGQGEILKRYFLLTYLFKFNKMNSK